MSRSVRSLFALTTAATLGLTLVPNASALTGAYVALGDSYSAGTGTDAKVNDCYRSPYGYPALVASATGYTLDYQACQGATTADVTANQLGTLNAATKYVTMTIGGNDVGFADVITECALPGWMSNCSGAINGGRSIMTNQLPGRYDSLFASIRTKAPNAKVAIGGYPRLFNGQDCSWATFFTSSEMSSLNSATNDLDTLIRSKATARGFSFVDPRGTFTGHAVCDTVEYVNGLSWPIEESFHPNRQGNAAYANLFLAAGTQSAAAAKTSGSLAATQSSALRVAPASKPSSSKALRQQAAAVLAMDLASAKNLAKARAAKVPPGTIVRIVGQLRSNNDKVLLKALQELHALDAAYAARQSS